MEQVSSHFLEQTLDKKLMSDLRVPFILCYLKWVSVTNVGGQYAELC